MAQYPSTEAIEAAKDIRVALMQTALDGCSGELKLPAGHLAIVAKHLDDFVSWRPIHTAPKDGTWIFVAIPPKVVPRSINSTRKIRMAPYVR